MNKRQQKKSNKHNWIPVMMRVKLHNGKVRNRPFLPFGPNRYDKILAVPRSDGELELYFYPDRIQERKNYWLQELKKAGGYWGVGSDAGYVFDRFSALKLNRKYIEDTTVRS